MSQRMGLRHAVIKEVLILRTVIDNKILVG